ncbi:MAG: penicillin-binding transpeptidase domain-containing protein [Planctomycetaceae bacterium]
MRNAPLSSVYAGPLRASAAVAPVGRIALLFGLVAVLTLTVVGRVAWVQMACRDDLLVVWDQPAVSFEPIPSHDGRIMTSDGQVLAYDDLSFRLDVHYRWLEEPPDPSWLSSQVRGRLTPVERRDAARREREREQVLQERRQMHRELAALLGVNETELRSRFRAIQERVERIVASVESRRVGRSDLTTQQVTTTPPSDPEDSLWDRVVRELTTPPQRESRDPVIVAEELAYHPIATRLPIRSVGLIESYPSRFPGISIEVDTTRVYPEHDLAPHLVGVRTPVTDEELAKARSTSNASSSPDETESALFAGERIGRGGVEQAGDRELRGRSGLKRIVRNRQGEVLETSIVRAPVDGRDIVLTLDSRLQREAERLLDIALKEVPPPATTTGSKFDDRVTPTPGDDSVSGAVRPVGGCLVAIDVRTGEILAAASAPRYDVNLLVQATESEWNAVARHPGRPFFPRATQATVPPGSIFKILSSVAMLESGAIDPQQQVNCRGYLDQPESHRCAIFRRHGVGHGNVDLQDALCESCNVYFFDAARKVGAQPMETWARRFGLGETTGLDIGGERAGLVPSSREATRERPWYPGHTLQLAIGQGDLLVTPLQVARMMAAVANDGWLVTPQLLRNRNSPDDNSPSSIEASDGIQLAGHTTIRRETTPPHRIDELSPTTLAEIRDGLQRVVTDPRGTGRLAAVESLTVAGKTGTAEVGRGLPDHAWFVGYAPAESPRVAFVVFLEHGGSGGKAAAPLAKQFVESLIEYRVLSPRRPPLRP